MRLTFEERYEIRDLISELSVRKPDKFTWTPFERRAYELLMEIYNRDTDIDVND